MLTYLPPPKPEILIPGSETSVLHWQKLQGHGSPQGGFFRGREYHEYRFQGMETALCRLILSCTRLPSLRLYWKVLSGLKTIQLAADRFRRTGACGPWRAAWQLPERRGSRPSSSRSQAPLLFLRLGKALSWRFRSSLLSISHFHFPVVAPLLSFFLIYFLSGYMLRLPGLPQSGLCLVPVCAISVICPFIVSHSRWL